MLLRLLILGNFKNKNIRQLIKDIRARIRKVYGLFLDKSIKKRDELLDAVSKTDNKNVKIELILKILSLHLSTKERINYMAELYEKVFSITGKPKIILDLGCGLNPLTVPFMNISDVKYYASELNKSDVDFLNRFFKIMAIDGKAVKMDLLKDYSQIRKYSCDVCFLFKVLESLDEIKKFTSHKVLENISAKYFVVSFPLKTVTGKDMRFKQRAWFEKLISKIGKKYTVFSMGNEISHVVQ